MLRLLLVTEATAGRLASRDGLKPRGKIPIRGREATLSVLDRRGRPVAEHRVGVGTPGGPDYLALLEWAERLARYAS